METYIIYTIAVVFQPVINSCTTSDKQKIKYLYKSRRLYKPTHDLFIQKKAIERVTNERLISRIIIFFTLYKYIKNNVFRES